MGNGFVFSLLAITSLNPSQIKYTKYQQVPATNQWVLPDLPVADLDQYNNNLEKNMNSQHCSVRRFWAGSLKKYPKQNKTKQRERELAG